MARAAFIVGNGPSTTPERLDNLIGKYTIGMNRVSMIFDKTDNVWRWIGKGLLGKLKDEGGLFG